MDHSSTIVVSDSNSDIHTLFSPPINSHTDRDYELAMVNLETYYSFANIRDTNNCLKWKGKGDKEWSLVRVPVGCYELKDISEEICRLRGNTDLTFLPNVNTLQCIMTVVGTDLKVSFDTPSSLADVLGFEKNKVYSAGRHASEELVNIMKVNSILAHCNIIHSSFIKGLPTPVIYNFFPNAAPGQKIQESPHNLIYLPVIVDVISTLSMWLTDQDREHLDLRGEKLTIRIHLREQ